MRTRPRIAGVDGRVGIAHGHLQEEWMNVGDPAVSLNCRSHRALLYSHDTMPSV